MQSSMLILLYLLASAWITVSVARSLYVSGQVFLVDVFHGDSQRALTVNRLLVVGFYLTNLGLVAMLVRSDPRVTSVEQVIEFLSTRLGVVLVILGAMHFWNLFVLTWLRSAAVARSR